MLNINANINGARKGLPYPTAGLQVIVYNSTYEEEGTTYLRTSTGVGIPKVSGTGLDTIWDFSVLNDARFDKGSYVGNAYGLPEYYDFPFVNIYFDETSETTRYHWKFTDFHYANLLAQSLLLDNQMFLRAKATTETSNEISEVYQLNIYESEQTGSALTKLKSWMRIASDFYGDELFDSYPYLTLPKLNGILSIPFGLSSELSIENSNAKVLQVVLDNSYIGIGWSNAIDDSKSYILNFKIFIDSLHRHANYWFKSIYDSSKNVNITEQILENQFNEITLEFSGVSYFFIQGINEQNIGDYFLLKELSMKEVFKNYYKP